MVATVTGGGKKKTKQKRKTQENQVGEKSFSTTDWIVLLSHTHTSTHTLWVHHDLSVSQVGQSSLLLLAEEPADGRLDAFLLGLLVQGVLAAGDATEGAGLGLQGGHDPGEDKHQAPLISTKETFLFLKKILN